MVANNPKGILTIESADYITVTDADVYFRMADGFETHLNIRFDALEWNEDYEGAGATSFWASYHGDGETVIKLTYKEEA